MVQDFDPVISAFRIFDSNHSGVITKEELVHLVSRLPDVGKVRLLSANKQKQSTTHETCSVSAAVQL